MDYAQYVSRRPPSPPALHGRHRAYAASPSLSSTASSLSHDAHRRHPAPIRTTAAVSAQLHRRAVRDEYAALAALVAASAHADDQRDRQEVVRIRLEDMLTHADPRSMRVLHLALEKCNSKLDSLAASTRHVDDARARMRVIESKHFHGARAASLVAPELRTMHIRREGVATLVEHIQCTLYDQVRIHYFLTELQGKLHSLRALLYSLDRADRLSTDGASDRADSPTPPPTPPPRSSFTVDPARRPAIPRRASRGAFRTTAEDNLAFGDRTQVRGNSLRSQRSLPRRHEGRLIPFVVKRALSYNASPLAAPPQQPQAADASWWSESANANDRGPRRSDSHLNAGGGKTHSDRSRTGSVDSSGSLRGSGETTTVASLRSHRKEDFESCDEDPSMISPVSRCTTVSEYSPSSKDRPRPPQQSAVDQSVLLDIDSLCTEASSALSSSRGMDSEKPARRGSVSSSLFHVSEPGRRSRRLGRLRIGRMRIPSQIKKLWLEINELYGIVLTHGPHLLDEKIVDRASMETGILGPWTSPKKGKSANVRVSYQTGIVIEAIRKVDSIVLWQQRLIVAIRRDHHEQRKALRQADRVISQAYLQSLNTGDGKT